MEKKTWKQMHLDYLKFKYGKKAEKWLKEEWLHDDRLVFVNVYRLMIEAVNSLPEEPNNYVCVALNHKMRQDCQMLDEIMDVFMDR